MRHKEMRSSNMETTRTPETQCPSCQCSIDAATALTEDVTPSPGDFTVCIQCAAILRFDRELHLKETVYHELKELDTEALEELALIRAVIAKMHRSR